MANQVFDLPSRPAEDEDNPTKAGLCNVPFHERQPCEWLESNQKFAAWQTRVGQWQGSQVKCPTTHMEAAVESRLGLAGFASIPDAGTTARPIMDIYGKDITSGQQEANRAARSTICTAHYLLQLMGFNTTELPNLIDINTLLVKMGGRRQVENSEFQWYRENVKPAPISTEDLQRVLGLTTSEPLEWYDQSFADMFTGSLSIPSKCTDQWSKMVSIIFKEVKEGNSDVVAYLRANGGKEFTNFKLESEKGNCRRCFVPFTAANKTPQGELCTRCTENLQELRTHNVADSDYEDNAASTERQPTADAGATFRSGATPTRKRWQPRPHPVCQEVQDDIYPAAGLYISQKVGSYQSSVNAQCMWVNDKYRASTGFMFHMADSVNLVVGTGKGSKVRNLTSLARRKCQTRAVTEDTSMYNGLHRATDYVFSSSYWSDHNDAAPCNGVADATQGGCEVLPNITGGSPCTGFFLTTASIIYNLLPYATINVGSIFDMDKIKEEDSSGSTGIQWREGVTDWQIVAVQHFILDEHKDITGSSLNEGKDYKPLKQMTIKDPDASNFNNMARLSELLQAFPKLATAIARMRELMQTPINGDTTLAIPTLGILKPNMDRKEIVDNEQLFGTFMKKKARLGDYLNEEMAGLCQSYIKASPQQKAQWVQEMTTVMDTITTYLVLDHGHRIIVSNNHNVAGTVNNKNDEKLTLSVDAWRAVCRNARFWPSCCFERTAPPEMWYPGQEKVSNSGIWKTRTAFYHVSDAIMLAQPHIMVYDRTMQMMLLRRSKATHHAGNELHLGDSNAGRTLIETYWLYVVTLDLVNQRFPHIVPHMLADEAFRCGAFQKRGTHSHEITSTTGCRLRLDLSEETRSLWVDSRRQAKAALLQLEHKIVEAKKKVVQPPTGTQVDDWNDWNQGRTGATPSSSDGESLPKRQKTSNSSDEEDVPQRTTLSKSQLLHAMETGVCVVPPEAIQTKLIPTSGSVLRLVVQVSSILTPCLPAEALMRIATDRVDGDLKEAIEELIRESDIYDSTPAQTEEGKERYNKGTKNRRNIVETMRKQSFHDKCKQTLPVEWYRVDTTIEITVAHLQPGEANRAAAFLDYYFEQFRKEDVLGFILTTRTLGQHTAFHRTVGDLDANQQDTDTASEQAPGQTYLVSFTADVAETKASTPTAQEKHWCQTPTKAMESKPGSSSDNKEKVQHVHVGTNVVEYTTILHLLTQWQKRSMQPDISATKQESLYLLIIRALSSVMPKIQQTIPLRALLAIEPSVVRETETNLTPAEILSLQEVGHITTTLQGRDPIKKNMVYESACVTNTKADNIKREIREQNEKMTIHDEPCIAEVLHHVGMSHQLGGDVHAIHCVAFEISVQTNETQFPTTLIYTDSSTRRLLLPVNTSTSMAVRDAVARHRIINPVTRITEETLNTKDSVRLEQLHKGIYAMQQHPVMEEFMIQAFEQTSSECWKNAGHALRVSINLRFQSTFLLFMTTQNMVKLCDVLWAKRKEIVEKAGGTQNDVEMHMDQRAAGPSVSGATPATLVTPVAHSLTAYIHHDIAEADKIKRTCGSTDSTSIVFSTEDKILQAGAAHTLRWARGRGKTADGQVLKTLNTIQAQAFTRATIKQRSAKNTTKQSPHEDYETTRWKHDWDYQSIASLQLGQMDCPLWSNYDTINPTGAEAFSRLESITTYQRNRYGIIEDRGQQAPRDKLYVKSRTMITFDTIPGGLSTRTSLNELETGPREKFAYPQTNVSCLTIGNLMEHANDHMGYLDPPLREIRDQIVLRMKGAAKTGEENDRPAHSLKTGEVAEIVSITELPTGVWGKLSHGGWLQMSITMTQTQKANLSWDKSQQSTFQHSADSEAQGIGQISAYPLVFIFRTVSETIRNTLTEYTRPSDSLTNISRPLGAMGETTMDDEADDYTIMTWASFTTEKWNIYNQQTNVVRENPRLNDNELERERSRRTTKSTRARIPNFQTPQCECTFAALMNTCVHWSKLPDRIHQWTNETRRIVAPRSTPTSCTTTMTKNSTDKAIANYIFTTMVRQAIVEESIIADEETTLPMIWQSHQGTQWYDDNLIDLPYALNAAASLVHMYEKVDSHMREKATQEMGPYADAKSRETWDEFCTAAFNAECYQQCEAERQQYMSQIPVEYLEDSTNFCCTAVALRRIALYVSKFFGRYIDKIIPGEETIPTTTHMTSAYRCFESTMQMPESPVMLCKKVYKCLEGTDVLLQMAVENNVFQLHRGPLQLRDVEVVQLCRSEEHNARQLALMERKYPVPARAELEQLNEQQMQSLQSLVELSDPMPGCSGATPTQPESGTAAPSSGVQPKRSYSIETISLENGKQFNIVKAPEVPWLGNLPKREHVCDTCVEQITICMWTQEDGTIWRQRHIKTSMQKEYQNEEFEAARMDPTDLICHGCHEELLPDEDSNPSVTFCYTCNEFQMHTRCAIKLLLGEHTIPNDRIEDTKLEKPLSTMAKCPNCRKTGIESAFIYKQKKQIPDKFLLSIINYDPMGTMARRIQQSQWYKDKIQNSICLSVNIAQLDRAEQRFEDVDAKQTRLNAEIQEERMKQIKCQAVLHPREWYVLQENILGYRKTIYNTTQTEEQIVQQFQPYLLGPRTATLSCLDQLININWPDWIEKHTGTNAETDRTGFTTWAGPSKAVYTTVGFGQTFHELYKRSQGTPLFDHPRLRTGVREWIQDNLIIDTCTVRFEHLPITMQETMSKDEWQSAFGLPETSIEYDQFDKPQGFYADVTAHVRIWAWVVEHNGWTPVTIDWWINGQTTSTGFAPQISAGRIACLTTADKAKDKLLAKQFQKELRSNRRQLIPKNVASNRTEFELRATARAILYQYSVRQKIADTHSEISHYGREYPTNSHRYIMAQLRTQEHALHERLSGQPHWSGVLPPSYAVNETRPTRVEQDRDGTWREFFAMTFHYACLKLAITLNDGIWIRTEYKATQQREKDLVEHVMKPARQRQKDIATVQCIGCLAPWVVEESERQGLRTRNMTQSQRWREGSATDPFNVTRTQEPYCTTSWYKWEPLEKLDAQGTQDPWQVYSDLEQINGLYQDGAITHDLAECYEQAEQTRDRSVPEPRQMISIPVAQAFAAMCLSGRQTSNVIAELNVHWENERPKGDLGEKSKHPLGCNAKVDVALVISFKIVSHEEKERALWIGKTKEKHMEFTQRREFDWTFLPDNDQWATSGPILFNQLLNFLTCKYCNRPPPIINVVWLYAILIRGHKVASAYGAPNGQTLEEYLRIDGEVINRVVATLREHCWYGCAECDDVVNAIWKETVNTTTKAQQPRHRQTRAETTEGVITQTQGVEPGWKSEAYVQIKAWVPSPGKVERRYTDDNPQANLECCYGKRCNCSAAYRHKYGLGKPVSGEQWQQCFSLLEETKERAHPCNGWCAISLQKTVWAALWQCKYRPYLLLKFPTAAQWMQDAHANSRMMDVDETIEQRIHRDTEYVNRGIPRNSQRTTGILTQSWDVEDPQRWTTPDDDAVKIGKRVGWSLRLKTHRLLQRTTMGPNVQEGDVTAVGNYNMGTNEYPQEEWNAADVFMGLSNITEYNKAMAELSDIVKADLQIIMHSNTESCMVTALAFAPVIDKTAKLLIHDEVFKNEVLDAKLSTMTHRKNGRPIKDCKTLRRLAIADEFKRILLSNTESEQLQTVIDCIEEWAKEQSLLISISSVVRPLCYQMANMWMYEYEEEKRWKRETHRQQTPIDADPTQSQMIPHEAATAMWQSLMEENVQVSDESQDMDVEPDAADISPTIPFDPLNAYAQNSENADETLATAMEIDQLLMGTIPPASTMPTDDDEDRMPLDANDTATRATPPVPVVTQVDDADHMTVEAAENTVTRATPPVPVSSTADHDIQMSEEDHGGEIPPELMRDILRKTEYLMKTKRSRPSALLQDIEELIEPTIANFAAEDDGLKGWALNPSAEKAHCDYFHATSRACFNNGYAIGACQEVGTDQHKKFDLWITLTDELESNRMTILGHPAYVKRIKSVGNYTYKDTKTTIDKKTNWLTYYQVADVELHNGKTIRLINVHLHHNTAKAFSPNIHQMKDALREALQQLLGYISPRFMTIIVGDFNQTGARGLLTTYLNEIVRERSQNSTVVQEVDYAQLRILDTISRHNPDENSIDSDDEHMRGEPCDCVITNIEMPKNVEITEWKIRNGKSKWGDTFNKAESGETYKHRTDKRGIVVRNDNGQHRTVSKLVPRHDHTKGKTESKVKPEHHTNLFNLGLRVKPVSIDYTTQIAQKMFYEEIHVWPDDAEVRNKRKIEVKLVRAEVDQRLQLFDTWVKNNLLGPDPRYGPLPERRTELVTHDQPEVQIDMRDFEIHCRCYIIFRLGGEYTFPPELDGEDRQEVHHFADLYNLQAEAYGEEPREIVVSTLQLAKAQRSQRHWTREQVENQGVWARVTAPPPPPTIPSPMEGTDSEIIQLSEDLNALQTSVDIAIRNAEAVAMARTDEMRATPPISQGRPAGSSTDPLNGDVPMTDVAAAAVARAQAHGAVPPAHKPRPAPPAPTVPQRKDKQAVVPQEKHPVEEFLPAEHALSDKDVEIKTQIIKLLENDKYVCDDVDILQMQIRAGKQPDAQLLDKLFSPPDTTNRKATSAELEWQKRMQSDPNYPLWDFINDTDAKEEIDNMTTSEKDNWYRISREIICHIQPESTKERWELLTRRNFNALMKGQTASIWFVAPLPANLDTNSTSKAYIRSKLKEATLEDKKILLLRYCKALQKLKWSAGLGKSDNKERRERQWMRAECHKITRDYFMQSKPKPRMRVGDLNAALAGVMVSKGDPVTTKTVDNTDAIVMVEQLAIRRATDSPNHIPWHEEGPDILPITEAVKMGIIKVPTTWEPAYWLQNLRDTRQIGYTWYNLAEHYEGELQKAQERNPALQTFCVVDTLTMNDGIRWIFKDSSMSRNWKVKQKLTEETRIQWSHFEDGATLTYGIDLFPTLYEGFGTLTRACANRNINELYNGRRRRGNPHKWLSDAVREVSTLRHDHAKFDCTKATSDWIPWSDILKMVTRKIVHLARRDFPELRNVLWGRNGDRWASDYITEPEVLGALLINNSTEQGQRQRLNFAVISTLHGRVRLPKSEAIVHDGALMFPNSDGQHHPNNPVRCNCEIPDARQWHREKGYQRDLEEAESQNRLTFTTTHFQHDDLDALECVYAHAGDQMPDELILYDLMAPDTLAYVQLTHGDSEDANWYQSSASTYSQFQAIRAKTPMLTPKAILQATTGFCNHITTWEAVPGILALGMKANTKGRVAWQASLHHHLDERAKMLRNQRQKDSQEYCILVILSLKYMSHCNAGNLFITTNGLITVTGDTDPDAISEIWYYPGGVHRCDPSKATLIYNKALQTATLVGTDKRADNEKFSQVVYEIKASKEWQRKEPAWKREQSMKDGVPLMYATSPQESDRLFAWGRRPRDYAPDNRIDNLFRCQTCGRQNPHNILFCWYCADPTVFSVPDNDDITFCPFEYQTRAAEKTITPEEYSREVQRMVSEKTVSAATATYATVTGSEGMSITCKAVPLEDDEITSLTTDHKAIVELMRQLWNNFRMYYFKSAEGLVNDPTYFGMPEHVVQQILACGKWPGSISTGECTDPQAWLDAFKEARVTPTFRTEDLPWHTIVTAAQLRVDMADVSVIASHMDDDEIEIQSSTAVYIGNKTDRDYGKPHNPFLSNLWKRFTKLYEMLPTIISKSGTKKAEELQRTAAHLSPTPVSDVHICLVQTLFKKWMTEMTYHADPANNKDLLDKMKGNAGYYKWLWNQSDNNTQQQRQWVEDILQTTMETLKSTQEKRGMSMPYEDDKQLMKYIRFIIVRTASKHSDERQAAMRGSQIEVHDPTAPLNRIKERIKKIRASVTVSPFLITASEMTVAAKAADIGATPNNVTASSNVIETTNVQCVISIGLLVILATMIIGYILKTRQKPVRWCLMITAGKDKMPEASSAGNTEGTRRRRRVRRVPLNCVFGKPNHHDPTPSTRNPPPYIPDEQPWHSWLDHDEILGLGYCAACWSYRPEIQLNLIAHPHNYKVCDMCLPNLIQGTMNTMSECELNRHDIQRVGEFEYFKKALIKGRQITSCRILFQAWKDELYPRLNARETFQEWDKICAWDEQQMSMPARQDERRVRYYTHAAKYVRDEFQQEEMESHIIEDFGSYAKFVRNITQLAEDKFEDGIPPPPYDPHQRFRMGRYRHRLPMLNIHDETEHGQTLLERWKLMAKQAKQASILHKKSTMRVSETVGNNQLVTCQRCSKQENVTNAWKRNCSECGIAMIGQAYNDVFTDIVHLQIERRQLLESDYPLDRNEDCHIWETDHRWKEQGLASLALQQVLTQAQCQRDELRKEVRQIEIMKKMMGRNWKYKARHRHPPAARTKWSRAQRQTQQTQSDSKGNPILEGHSSSSDASELDTEHQRRGTGVRWEQTDQTKGERATSPSPPTSSNATQSITLRARSRDKSEDDDYRSRSPSAKTRITLTSRAERWTRAASSSDTALSQQPQRKFYYDKGHSTACDGDSNGATPVLSLVKGDDCEQVSYTKKRTLQSEQIHGMQAPADEEEVSTPTWFDKEHDMGITTSADEFTWLYEPSDDWLQKWGSEYLYLPADVQRRRREALAREDRRKEKRLGNVAVSQEYYDLFWHKDPPQCHKQVVCATKMYKEEDMPTAKPWMLRPARISDELLSLAWVTKDGVDYHVNSVKDPDLRGLLALPPTKCDKLPVPKVGKAIPKSRSKVTTQKAEKIKEKPQEDEENFLMTKMPRTTMNQIVDRLSRKTTIKETSQSKRKSSSAKGTTREVAVQTEAIAVVSGATPATTATADVATNTTVTYGTTVDNEGNKTDSDIGSDNSCDYDPKPRECEYCGRPIQRWMGGPICYSCECGN